MASLSEAGFNDSFDEQFFLETSHTATDLYTTRSIIICTVLAILLGLLCVSTKTGLKYLAAVTSHLRPPQSHPPVPGCRRIGIPESDSNLLHDEYSAKYRQGDASGDGKTWKVKSIWVYPIKSCAGVELGSSTILKTGPEYDRMFSFAQWEKGRWNFSTARSHPLMVKLRTEIWVPDRTVEGFDKGLESVRTKGVVRIVFPNPRAKAASWGMKMMAALRGGREGAEMVVNLPLQPTEEMIEERYTVEPFEIWRESVRGVNMSRHIPAELREFLGTVKPGVEFALFRVHEMREVFRDAPRKEVLGWQPIAGFNDAYPVNLVGVSSLQATQEMQETTRGMVMSEKGRDLGAAPLLGARRFRANIIVEGTPEFEEEEWKYIRLGEEEFYVVARCVRCKLPNVNPDTGLAHKVYPDVAIRRLRQVDNGAPKNTGCLAVQMVPKREGGRINVGDVISVQERGEHVYIPMGS